MFFLQTSAAAVVQSIVALYEYVQLLQLATKLSLLAPLKKNIMCHSQNNNQSTSTAAATVTEPAVLSQSCDRNQSWSVSAAVRGRTDERAPFI